MMFFHYKYLYETIKDSAGTYAGAGTFNLQITNPIQAAAVMRAMDADFENSESKPRPKPSRPSSRDSSHMVGPSTILLNTIGMAVAFTILLVTANTMSMAVRERRTEIAVLKTLGFPGRLVIGRWSSRRRWPRCASVAGRRRIGAGHVGYMAKIPVMGSAFNVPGLSM